MNMRVADLSLHVSQTLSQTPLAKLPSVHEALFGEVDVLHVWRIGGGCATDTRGDHDGVGLKDNTVINGFVNSEGDKVIVLDNGTLVGSTPVGKSTVSSDCRPGFAGAAGSPIFYQNPED